MIEVKRLGNLYCFLWIPNVFDQMRSATHFFMDRLWSVLPFYRCTQRRLNIKMPSSLLHRKPLQYGGEAPLRLLFLFGCAWAFNYLNNVHINLCWVPYNCVVWSPFVVQFCTSMYRVFMLMKWVVLCDNLIIGLLFLLCCNRTCSTANSSPPLTSH